MNATLFRKPSVFSFFAGLFFAATPAMLTGGEVYKIDLPVADVAVQTDQKILVAGHGADLICLNEITGNISRRRGGVFRLHSDGSIDENFQSKMSAMSYLKLRHDGRLLVHGSFNDPKRKIPGSFAILLPDGGIDESFVPFHNLSNGVPSLPLNWNSFASLYPVALESEGCVLMPPLRDPRIPKAAFARFDVTGRLLPMPNNEFPYSLRGGHGLEIRTGQNLGVVARETFEAVPVELCRIAFRLSDGSIVVLVREQQTDRLRRIKQGWQVDEGFICKIEFDEHPLGDISLIEQPDGKFVLGGNFNKVNGVQCTGLVRLLPDGSVDGNFHCTLDNKKGWQGWPGIRIAVQRDGRIVLGGFFERVNGIDCRYLARLNSDGSIDGEFQRHSISPDKEVAGLRIPVAALRTTSVTNLTLTRTTGASNTINTTTSGFGYTILITLLEINPGGNAVMKYTGQPNRPYILQASEQIGTTAWNSIATNITDGEGLGSFQDKDAAKWPSRFYRVAKP